MVGKALCLHDPAGLAGGRGHRNAGAQAMTKWNACALPFYLADSFFAQPQG